MTVIGWIQILLFCAIVVALVKPLGWYMTRVFNGERTFLSPVLRPVEARPLLDRRRRREARTALADLYGRDAAVPCRRLSDHLWPDAAAGAVAVQPGGAIRGRRRSVLQHCDLLHHQHQLAELRRREHAVVPDADARADAPEFPVGGDRHRARGGADPRLLPFLDAHHRQFLGRCDPLHALCAAADLHRLHAVPGRQGMPQTLGAYVDATTLEGAKQTIAVGPVASQVAIKMLGTNGGGFFNANAAHPFENPDRAVELRADDLDLRARRRDSPTCSVAWSATSARAGRSSP